MNYAIQPNRYDIDYGIPRAGGTTTTQIDPATETTAPPPPAPSPAPAPTPAPTPAPPATEDPPRMAGDVWNTKKYGLDGIGEKDIEGWKGEGKSDSEIYGEIGKAIDAGGLVGKKAREKYERYQRNDSNTWDTKQYGGEGIGIKDIQGWRQSGKLDSHIFGQIERAQAEGRPVGARAQAALDKYTAAGHQGSRLDSDATNYKYYVEGDAAGDGGYRSELQNQLKTYGGSNGGHTFLNTGTKEDADFIFNKTERDFGKLFESKFNYT